MENQLSEKPLGNVMLEAFEDPKFNIFGSGMEPAQCNENRRICLKNVPSKLSQNGIQMILSQFGSVVDIHIPKNQDRYKEYKDGFIHVFAEFSKFNETEKAVRELNGRKNEGLAIRAEFAHAKREVVEEPDLNEVIKRLEREECFKAGDEKNDVDSPEEVINPIMYDIPDDDIIEKVSAFKRKKRDIMNKETTSSGLEHMERLAKQSLGTYDELTDTITFNSAILEQSTVFRSKCCQCEREALLKCEVSARNFCSLKCSFLKDEPTQAETPLRRNQIRYSDRVKVNDQVIVCGVINEKCIYVWPIEQDIVSFMNKVRKLSKRAKKLEKFPNVDDLVLVYHLDDVYRAKVIQITDDDHQVITVQLIDFGNTDQVNFEDLAEMNYECQNLKCYAQKILLKDVKIDAINYGIVDFLNFMILDESKLTVTEVYESKVVLVNKLSSININHKINELSIVEEASYEDKDPVEDQDIESSLIPTGRNQRVLVVNARPYPDKPEYFCCVSETMLRDFYQLYNTINVYGNSIQRPNQFGIPFESKKTCLGFTNGQWHRIVVETATGDSKPKCILKDILKLEKVKVTKIIPMPAIFSRPRSVVELCKIENFNEEMKTIVESTIQDNKMIMLDHVTETEHEVIVRIDSILKPVIPKLGVANP